MGKGRKKAAAKRATVSKEDMSVAVIPARKKKDWKEDMPDREFKNERQVDITKLDNKCHGIPTIEQRGLEFWFNPLEGYNKEIVVEFYQNMVFYIEEPNRKDYRVESKVGRIPILVTPDEIAKYLNYKRPPLQSINYPPPIETRLDEGLIKAALYEDITDYEGKYAPGSFKEEYRFINKVINANLYPRGSESLLRDGEAELLYAFMNDKYVIDVAEMIFYQIVNFQLNTHFSAKMPFPCMITKFCQTQGVKGKKYEKLEPLKPGPLNQTSVHKSNSDSTALSSSKGKGKGKGKEKLTDLPNEKAKPGAWLRKLCCHTSWIITEIKKSKKKEKEDRKKMKQTRKEIRYLRAENDWLVKQVEKSSKTKFVPPTEVEVESEESEDDEEDEPPLVQTQVGRTVPHGRGTPGNRGKNKSTVKRRSKVPSPVVSSEGDDDEEDDNSDDGGTTTDEEEEEENEDDENEEDGEEESEEDVEEENEEDAEDTDTIRPSKKAKKQH